MGKIGLAVRRTLSVSNSCMCFLCFLFHTDTTTSHCSERLKSTPRVACSGCQGNPSIQDQARRNRISRPRNTQNVRATFLVRCPESIADLQGSAILTSRVRPRRSSCQELRFCIGQHGGDVSSGMKENRWVCLLTDSSCPIA